MTLKPAGGSPLAVRNSVLLPLHFADGYTTMAEVFSFHGLADGKEHIALGLGNHQRAYGEPAPLVRIHSECLTGDVFGSQRCDCGAQLRESVESISAVGGYVLYLRQEGRGIGLYEKLDAYTLQDQGMDTYEANRALGRADDERSYIVAAQMLTVLGARRIDLLSNNPDKSRQLSALGIEVVLHVRTGVHVSDSNLAYLSAKAQQHSHTLDIR